MLFGRDSLWAARSTLPFGTDLAAGTLRTLARRQGRVDDPETAESRARPGRGRCDRRTIRRQLPPLYHGTVDATPLWVAVARRLALGPGRTTSSASCGRSSTPRSAGSGAASRRSPDDFLSYVDATGTGLSNQGLEGLRRRDAPPRRHGRGGADRTGRDLGLRRRGGGRGGRAARVGSGESGADCAGSATGSDTEMFWSPTTTARPGDGAGPSRDPSTGSAARWATSSAPARSAARRARWSPPACRHRLLGPFGVGTLGRANLVQPDRPPHRSVWTHYTRSPRSDWS